jgi:hypothetical protein
MGKKGKVVKDFFLLIVRISLLWHLPVGTEVTVHLRMFSYRVYQFKERRQVLLTWFMKLVKHTVLVFGNKKNSFIVALWLRCFIINLKCLSGRMLEQGEEGKAIDSFSKRPILQTMSSIFFESN